MIQSIVNSVIICVVMFFALTTYAQAQTLGEKATGEQASADHAGSQTTQSGQEQRLEAQLLQLDAELQLLEEDLLYPASSRVAIYLSMDLGELFALDAVTLKLNGKDVAHHLYTQREVDALYKGGVQKLYVGNAKQGKNRVTAFFTGEGPHERDYKRATSLEFEQSFEPVFVELTVTDNAGRQQPEFVSAVF